MTIQRAVALASTTVAGTLLLSGGRLLLHPRDPGLIAITVQLGLLLVIISPLWLLRPPPVASPLPPPPWGSQRRMRPRRPQGLRRARGRLWWVDVRVALARRPPALPAHPRPAPQRYERAAPPLPAPRHRPHLRPLRFTLPLPTLDLEFVAPGQRPVRQVNVPAAQTALLDHAAAVMQATLDEPGPPVLALHDQPRHLTLQYAPTALLTPTQQRAMIAGLRARGVVATWRDGVSLTVRREALPCAPATMRRDDTTLWVPVLAERQTTIWWPLPHHEHLVLAGHSAAPLVGMLQRATARTLFIHDPEGQLRDHAARIDRRAAQPDALDQARRWQLQSRFAQERATVRPDAPPPLCLIVAPTEPIWSEVQPLLVPASGVQVVLILGDRPPLAPLRALCYRLPVLEIAQALTLPLPETFRPAGVPVPRPGQVVAWRHGGRVWWRGRVPTIAETPEDA